MAPFPFSRDQLPLKLFINNEYVPCKSTQTIAVHNPKDGSLVADNVPIGGEEDVEAAVEAAEKAFPSWRNMPSPKRRDMMFKLAALIDEHAEVLSELTRITLGAPYKTAGNYELGLGTETLRYYAGWIDKFAGESFPQDNDGFLKIVHHEPLGVCAAITPWNGPMATFGMKAGPALATGNCLILKPSEKTPFASLALGHLIKEAGFPPGVFQIISGDGSTGALLASHMRVRKISFTGSVATGKKVQEMATRSNLKRVTLELGGKSPAVIFDDCNLENAVEWAANSITINTGQVCIAGSRVYVQDGIYDAFIEKYKQAFQDRTKGVGDPDNVDTALGPLVDELQFSRVKGFIERGQRGQGNLLFGGKQIGNKGYFIEPTIFTDVDSDAEIHREEIFGPVSVVKRFKTEEEAIGLSNDTNFGLMAGVFTQDINKALRVAKAFESGVVNINCMTKTAVEGPFGGSKESGHGREGGIDGLRAYTEPKTIVINLNN
ncbi:hypothetical protein FQN51_000145 [Onygenales sp. PD_10]|nr:hypothetical protein FQN51_000145 [Onygenales sp. PD_10]